MYPSSPMKAMFLAIGFLGSFFGQSRRIAAPAHTFSELTPADVVRLNQQRDVVLAAARTRFGTVALTRTQKDLSILQKLIDDKVFDKSQTYQLQCLGVAFGDVLASELPLRWVIITDEYGRDPTLRYKNSDLNINALTMISKRVEKGESVNLSWLLHTTREQLAYYDQGAR